MHGGIKSPGTLGLVGGFLTLMAAAGASDPIVGKRTGAPYAEIRVLDAESGRGVPLVELETVHHVRFVTDNAGRIAVGDPDLLDREVFFYVHSHGYEVPKDGFGFRGVRLTLQAGQPSVIRLKRRQIAERLCRLTGEGLYRDSVLLGYRIPQLPAGGREAVTAERRARGLVAGQDSVQAALYRQRIFWFWGDTNRLLYPLGLFRTAGATTPLFKEDFDPAEGIPYEYFTDPSGFARPMIPYPQRPEGVIWIDGVCVVPDEQGQERLLCHYSRRKGLAEELEHGIALWNDDQQIFEPVRELPLAERWRHPFGHATRWVHEGVPYLLFGNPAPVVRVPARYQAVLDPRQYEAFSCASGVKDGKPVGPLRDDQGRLQWRWQKEYPPVDAQTEWRWLQTGRLQASETRFCPADHSRPSQRIHLHNGTVRWNPYRQRWLLIAGQIGGQDSLLGDVWYAEATEPTGPFRQAIRIVQHERYSFYNVCHHPFLDRQGGRFIHLEGTYTAEFSGNPIRTPRYDYNQILYRVDLDHPGLRAARDN
ncbi:MAG: hypothetical protein WHU94_06585 [Thermogemmata sp.]